MKQKARRKVYKETADEIRRAAGLIERHFRRTPRDVELYDLRDILGKMDELDGLVERWEAYPEDEA